MKIGYIISTTPYSEHLDALVQRIWSQVSQACRPGSARDNIAPRCRRTAHGPVKGEFELAVEASGHRFNGTVWNAAIRGGQPRSVTRRVHVDLVAGDLDGSRIS